MADSTSAEMHDKPPVSPEDTNNHNETNIIKDEKISVKWLQSDSIFSDRLDFEFNLNQRFIRAAAIEYNQCSHPKFSEDLIPAPAPFSGNSRQGEH